jgi:hypothetical protein
MYCGPTAVASIVGEPIWWVRNAFCDVRLRAGRIDYTRAPAIMGTDDSEVQQVLARFGFTGHWQTIPDRPTLAAFLEAREGRMRTHPCIIGVTHHWVAVSGWQFCDTLSKGLVVEADEAPGRRKRVREVFLITDWKDPAAAIAKRHSPLAGMRSAYAPKVARTA